MHKTIMSLVIVTMVTGLAFGGHKVPTPFDLGTTGKRPVVERKIPPVARPDRMSPGQPPQAQTDGWETPFALTTNTSAQYTGYAYQNPIAVDPSGNVHTVWYDTRVTPYHIHYRKWTRSSGTWGDSVILTNHGTRYDYRPGIACDNSGNVIVAWHSSTSGYYGIWMKRYVVSSGTWLAESLVATKHATLAPGEPSVATQQGGNNIHIVWTQRDSTTTYARVWHREWNTSTGWSAMTRVDTLTNLGAASAAGVAVDGSNNVFVTWQQRSYSYTYPAIWYRARLSGSWQGVENVTPEWYSSVYSYMPDIAVTSSGIPHVTWYGYPLGGGSTFYRIFYRNRSTGSWGTVDTVSYDPGLNGSSQYYPGLALRADTVHLVWRAYGTATSNYYWCGYRRRAGGVWGSIQYPVARTTGTLYYPGNCTDTYGNVHLTWYDTYNGNNDPWYCRRVPDFANDVGVQTVSYPVGDVPGRPMQPQAVIKNYGTVRQNNFAVRCTIYNLGGTVRYTNQQTVSIGPDSTLLVSFGSFTATNFESVQVVMRTALVGDQNPSNDRSTAQAVLYRPYYTGGPDGDNCYWIDSDTTGGPVYNWVSIISSGTPVPFPSYDDDIARIPIGFTFRYRGTNYDRLTVGTNGAISFDSVYITLSNDSMPNAGSPNNLVAALWDDLHCVGSGFVQYQTRGSSPNETLVISYDSIRYYSGGSQTLKFQFLLLHNGNRIVCQYRNVVCGYSGQDYGVSASVGFENATGTSGLNYVYLGRSPFGNRITNGRAIRFYQLTYDNDVGVTRVVYPVGGTPGRTNLTPVALVKNMGNLSQGGFAVRCTIYGAGGAVRYSNQQTVSSLNPGDTLRVSFTSFAPTVFETVQVAMRTALVGDQNPANDRSTAQAVLYQPFYTGGPDADYYYWIDSDTTGGPSYNWRDISATGTSVPFPSVDDDYARIPIGFNFRWRGTNYNRITVGTNGALSFDSTDITLANDSIPNAATPNNLAAALWDDLYCRQVGQVKYQTVGTSPNETLVVSYDNIQYYLSGDTTLSFQFLLLRSEMSVVIQYKNVATGHTSRDYGRDASVGIENSTGSTGLNYVYLARSPAGNMLTNGRAIRFYTVVHDVGCTRLLAPAGTLDSGTSVTPACSTYNYGNQTETYWVRMRIGAGYLDSAQVTGHAPGSYRYLTFSNWTAMPRGNYSAACTTRLGTDVDNSNDRATATGFVRVIDVGPTVITTPTPSGSYRTDTAIRPRATWRNNGNVSTGFQAWMCLSDPTDSRVYARFINVPSLAAGGSIEITTFPLCTLRTQGNWTTRCSSYTVGDLVPANDYMDAGFYVGSPDVGVASIVEPVGSFDSGVVVRPKALVRNYGDVAMSFSAWFVMRDSATGTEVYRQSLTLTGFPPSDDTTLEWPEWPKPHPGAAYRSLCSLAVTDRNPGNNKLSGSFTVTTMAAGWYPKNPMTSGAKPVKDGGWLSYDASRARIYASRGNKQLDFFAYDPAGDSWQALAPWLLGTEGKPPSKGSAGCADGNGVVYATKGNNKQGFHKYYADGDSWRQKKDVPLGLSNKKVKGGTDIVWAYKGSVGSPYLLKGYKNEFYRYDVDGDSWQTLSPAPPGANPKYDKGSWLAYDDVNNKIYAHKAKFHEFYRYDVEGDSWSGALTAMPIPGSAGSKKAKDGSCATYFGTRIYALKGGGTVEFWRYHINGDSWGELTSMPLGTSGKKVKAGADITTAVNVLYALKGNKQNELWMYVPGAFLFDLPERTGVMAGQAAIGDRWLAVAPNPIASGFATVRYGSARTATARLSIYNAAGQRVVNQVLTSRSGTANLDLRHLANGVYLVKLAADDAVVTQKLVVQR